MNVIWETMYVLRIRDRRVCFLELLHSGSGLKCIVGVTHGVLASFMNSNIPNIIAITIPSPSLPHVSMYVPTAFRTTLRF